jgi:hypothetical protein
MQLVMEVDRRGAQFTGTLRRPDDSSGVEFWGVLELVVALELLVPPVPPVADNGPGRLAGGR